MRGFGVSERAGGRERRTPRDARHKRPAGVRARYDDIDAPSAAAPMYLATARTASSCRCPQVRRARDFRSPPLRSLRGQPQCHPCRCKRASPLDSVFRSLGRGAGYDGTIVRTRVGMQLLCQVGWDDNRSPRGCWADEWVVGWMDDDGGSRLAVTERTVGDGCRAFRPPQEAGSPRR